MVQHASEDSSKQFYLNLKNVKQNARDIIQKYNGKIAVPISEVHEDIKKVTCIIFNVIKYATYLEAHNKVLKKVNKHNLKAELIEDWTYELNEGLEKIANLEYEAVHRQKRENQIDGATMKSLANVFENWTKHELEKLTKRKFVLNKKLDPGTKDPGEIDVFSLCEETKTAVIGEATLTLFEVDKVKKCAKKRDRVAEKFGLDPKDVKAYITTMQLSGNGEDSVEKIYKAIDKYNVELLTMGKALGGENDIVLPPALTIFKELEDTLEPQQEEHASNEI